MKKWIFWGGAGQGHLPLDSGSGRRITSLVTTRKFQTG